MNRKIMSIASVLMTVIALAFFSSCKEDESSLKPEFQWKGEQVVDGVFRVVAETNRYVLEYSIQNPVEGAAVTVSADKDWISVISPKSAEPEVSDGTLIFTVSDNNGGDREGRITLKYENMIDQVLTVKQAAANGNSGDGEVKPSDNVITIEVTDVQARQIRLIMTPTNDDPYAAVLCMTSDIAGKTDEQIINMCLRLSPKSVSGVKEEVIPNLNPMTDYSVLCFGCVSNTATTGLFRKDFKTKENQVGTATISVTWSDYYDIKAISQIDSEFKKYLEAGDCFVPLNVVTDPVDAETFYYGAYSEELLAQYDIPNTDEALSADLLSYEPAQDRDDAYILSYGEHNFIAALVADANGNLSKLWRSEIFILQKDGVSDPQDFLDKYAAPARIPQVNIPYALEISNPVSLF